MRISYFETYRLFIIYNLRSKRAILHISKECFVPFNVAIIFPLHSVYGDHLNKGLNMIIQSGIINKLKSDVEWEMMRSATGKLLAVSKKVTYRKPT